MRISILLTFVMSVTLLACKKSASTLQYTGVVVGVCEDCNVLQATQRPYIINLVKNGKVTDSILTATLPVNFQAPGKTIQFSMRAKMVNDPSLVCNTWHVLPRQVVVTGVK